MLLKLTRKIFTDKSTIGELQINEIFECYTLEDADRNLENGGIKVPGKTAIPRGRYEVIVTYSNRFKRPLPLLLNVPQFEGIRIHKGNTSEDTEGCILVGFEQRKNSVFNSRLAFDPLHKKISETKEKIFLKVA